MFIIFVKIMTGVEGPNNLSTHMVLIFIAL